MQNKSGLLLFLFILFFIQGWCQDSTAVTWTARTDKSNTGEYKLIFEAQIKPGWQLYGPDQDLSGTSSIELNFADSSFSYKAPIKAEGPGHKQPVALFNNLPFLLYNNEARLSVPLQIRGTVPARVFGSLTFYFGKADSFYSGNYAFSATLEGGVQSGTRIRISSFDLKHPVSNCGDTGTEGKGLLSIFLLGLLGGFIALLTPCVFPLIPLTVSFFTKRGGSPGSRPGSCFVVRIFHFHDLRLAQPSLSSA